MPPRGMMSDEPPKRFSFQEQWTLLKEFVSYYPRHRRLFALDLFVVLISPLFSTVLPVIVYKAFQTYLPEKNIRMLMICLGVIFFLTLCNILSEYIKTRWGHTLGVRMESDMRNDIFRHLQKLSFSYFDRTRTGHLMSRISNDLTMIAEMAHHCPEDIISATLMLIGGLTVMLWINPLLTLLTLLPVPLMIFWGGSFQNRMKNQFREVRRRVAEINSQVENSIQGVREVKSYTNEFFEIRKFKNVNKDFRVARENSFTLLALFHSGMMFFIHGYSVIFIALGVLMLLWGKADAAQLITFFMYSNQITMPVMRLVGFIEQYQQGITAFERFHEVMMEQPDILDKPDALTVLESPLKGELQFEHLSFQYPDMKESEPLILDDINLRVEAGRTLALVGESGAGKTTLAALIPRFYELRGGSIRIDGIDIRDFSQRLLRTNVGIVQQIPFLFDDTIRKNILFGKPDATEEEVIAAAKEANIYDFIQSLPDGLDSMCGENGVKLSGGQRQRISIARVFLKNPPILIFDEATSALDNESEALVQASMEQLCKNRTTILIAHRLSTVKNADFICCLRKGRIVESGTHAELLAKGGYYKQLYTMHTF